MASFGQSGSLCRLVGCSNSLDHPRRPGTPRPENLCADNRARNTVGRSHLRSSRRAREAATRPVHAVAVRYHRPQPHHLRSARRPPHTRQFWVRLFNLTWMVGLGRGAIREQTTSRWSRRRVDASQGCRGRNGSASQRGVSRAASADTAAVDDALRGLAKDRGKRASTWELAVTIDRRLQGKDRLARSPPLPGLPF